MEIGNVRPTCGIPISQARFLHLRDSRSASLPARLENRLVYFKNETSLMNWEMLTAIGQMAAVCVGIPSVIYFALQLREQTRERRQAAVNALTVQWGELTKALHENAEFTAVYLRGVQSFHELDPISKLRFSAFQNRFFKNFEGMYYSKREGILSAELWDEIDRTMSDFLAYKGIQEWWPTRRHWHTEAFDSVVDDIIARGEKPTAYSTDDWEQVVPPQDS